MHSNTHLRTKISLHMSFTPTSKNFDQNRNHIMKNQTNPTHVTQQHNTWNFIKNETLTEQKLKESNKSSLNLIRNETLTEPQTSKLEKKILFIHIHTYIHTYIYRESTRGFREEIELDAATSVVESGEAALFSLPHGFASGFRIQTLIRVSYAIPIS